MLQPSRTKYRRPHGLSYEGVATKGNTVAFGEYGLAALEGTYITDHQIEAARIVLAPYHVTPTVLARFGSESSLTSPSPRSQPKSVWVPVKVHQKDGSPSSRRTESCSRLAVSLKKSP